MGYVSDDNEHEGWDAAEFPDGRFSVGSGNGGALVRLLGPGHRDLDDEPSTVDGRTAIGWRAVCECGWRGPLWRRAATLDEQDLDRHLVYVPDPSQYGDPPAELEDVMWHEWADHLPPKSITAIRLAAEDAWAAERRLAEAVQAARAEGCSWAEIGAAAGMTRQAAHERWGKRQLLNLGGGAEESLP